MPKTTDREDIDQLALETAKLLDKIKQLKEAIVALKAEITALESAIRRREEMG